VLVLLVNISCEEENSLPSCTVSVSPREDAIVMQGTKVSISVIADDSDGEVKDIQILIDDEIMASVQDDIRLLYFWDTDHIEPKDYIIKVIVSDNSAGVYTKEFIYTIVGASPTPTFSNTDPFICAGDAISFTDESDYDPTSWLWDFGDGATSILQNPTHTYTQVGTYSVKLTASNENGSKDFSKGGLVTVVDSSITDYDNNTYQIVKIATQFWMAENIKSTHYADGTPLIDGTNAGNIDNDFITKYYFNYDDDQSNVDTYGRLYTWAAVMNGAESSNTNLSEVQGVCPDNWHVPSKLEWDQLIDHLGGEEIAGGKLKSKDYWIYPNTAATNESEFSALPAGIRFYESCFYKGEMTFFATTTENGSDCLYRNDLIFNDSKVIKADLAFKEIGMSVRCLKD